MMKNRALKEQVSQNIYNRLMELKDNGAMDNDIAFILATALAAFTHDTGIRIDIDEVDCKYMDFVDYLDMIGGNDDE